MLPVYKILTKKINLWRRLKCCVDVIWFSCHCVRISENGSSVEVMPCSQAVQYIHNSVAHSYCDINDANWPKVL